MKQPEKKRIRRVTAALLCAAMLAPVLVRGIPLTDANYNSDQCRPSWEEPGIPDLDEPTGLASNLALFEGYNMNAGARFPFNGAWHFTARPGYVKDEFKEFDNRFYYCVANHTQGYRIDPGQQMFFMKQYGINHPNGIFPAAKRGVNEEFNFLMLAIAAGYPQDNYDPESAANAPYYLICQTIAWAATDETIQGTGRANPGFKGGIDLQPGVKDLAQCFREDLALYKSSAVYACLTETFPRSMAPTIYDGLHAPCTNATAVQWGCTNAIDQVFYEIWRAAYITSCLRADWDQKISATVTTAREENGRYYADVSLFIEPGVRDYLTGIKFQGTNGWVQESQTEDGVMHFSSPTGETDEIGCIGYLYWPAGTIGGLLPVDQTKAKLYTFESYTNMFANPTHFSFGLGQTYFSSVMDQGINIYVRIGEEEEGGSEGGCVRHEHEETFSANYNLNLLKYDSETGKPLAGSHWDVLEKFDDTQLDNTDLDRTPDNPGSYESGLGTLNDTEWGDDEISSNYSGDMGVTVSDTNKYNWGNDDGTQFERWDDPHDDPCTRDDNVTKEDGLLYEIDSAGGASSDRAHSDVKLYTYHKGYCDGHPAPEIEYVECDHDEDEDCDCDEINQELHDEAWAAWYEEVKKCEQLVQEGGFFHCIEPGDAAKKAMEEDRDEFFKDFISLTYEYSAEEIQAAKGYILHGIHTDDIPLEWRVVTSSEYKDTLEATVLDHQATPGRSGGTTGEPPVDPDDGDEEDTDISGEEDTLWSNARALLRRDLPEEDLVSDAVKAEDPTDENIRETSEETEAEEMTATDGAATAEETAADETAMAEETAAADEETAADEKAAGKETTAAHEDTAAKGTAAADKETEKEPAETTADAGHAEDSLSDSAESRPDGETEGTRESMGTGDAEETKQEALSLSKAERTVTRASIQLAKEETVAEAESSAAVRDASDDPGRTKETEKETLAAETARERETEPPAGTDEAPEQEANGTGDGTGTSQTARVKAETEATVPAKENGTMAPAKNTARKAAEETVQDKDGDDFLADIDLLLDGETDIWATASNATESTARAEHTIRRTGFLGRIRETAENVWDYLTSLPGKGRKAMRAAGRAASYLRDTEHFQPTQASYVKPPKEDIIDWTFVVYDHRTEGEIHFNKRDFDLKDDEGTLFDAYAAENGDGALEGAVYGLFAAQDIIHPDTDGDGDGDTGVVFQKDDLVAVATTDRNGDASFMTITEAPGSVYHYETGSIEHTDWYGEAPKNLHIERNASAAKEQDIERFIGHNPDNSEITAGDGMDLPDTEEGDNTFHYKRSTNQEYDSGMLENNRVTNNKVDTYREDETTGYYPISDNEQNNGNCWIGRPLILGKEGSSYYIRELSRSEGYELSVYGKDGTFITNREAFEAGGGEFISGEAHAM